MWGGKVRLDLLTDGQSWAALSHSGTVFDPACEIATLEIALTPQSTIRLIQPPDSVRPFKHNSTQAMNEMSESLHCPLQIHPFYSVSSLKLHFFPLLFIQFHPPPATTHPTDCLIEEKEFLFFRRRKSNGRKEERARRQDMKPLPNRLAHPGQSLSTRGPFSRHFLALWIFVQVKISKEPSATKHSITFK